jgi:uncharacterized protein YndB with AHSA1/START domain
MTERSVSPSPTDTTDRELVLTRVIDAPRETVFAAFTDAENIGRWWGPRGFTITTRSIDIRVGGAWIFVMHGPNGMDWDNRIDYRAIVPGERIEYLHGAKQGDPEAFDVFITFEDEGGKTRVQMKSVFRTAAQVETVKGFGAVELGYQTLDKLAEHVASRRS